MTAETCLPQDLRANSFLMSRSSRDGVLGDRPMNSSSHQHAIHRKLYAVPFSEEISLATRRPSPFAGGMEMLAAWCLPVRRAWRSSKQTSSLSAVVFAPCFHALQRRCCCCADAVCYVHKRKKTLESINSCPPHSPISKSIRSRRRRLHRPLISKLSRLWIFHSIFHPEVVSCRINAGKFLHSVPSHVSFCTFARLWSHCEKFLLFVCFCLPARDLYYTTLVRERDSTYTGARHVDLQVLLKMRLAELNIIQLLRREQFKSRSLTELIIRCFDIIRPCVKDTISWKIAHES